MISHRTYRSLSFGSHKARAQLVDHGGHCHVWQLLAAAQNNLVAGTSHITESVLGYVTNQRSRCCVAILSAAPWLSLSLHHSCFSLSRSISRIVPVTICRALCLSPVSLTFLFILSSSLAIPLPLSFFSASHLAEILALAALCLEITLKQALP